MNNKENVSRCQVLLIHFTYIYIGLTGLWLLLDHLPFQWDQSWYLENSEFLYQAIRTGSIPTITAAYTNLLLGAKAPLISIIPAFFYFIIGHNRFAIYAAEIFWVLLFIVSAFDLLKTMFSEKIALISIITVSTMPLVFGLARNFLVEYQMMALVTLWINLAIKSSGFQSRRSMIYLGVLSGLGLLLKVMFPIYIVGPALYIFFSTVLSTKSKRTFWKSVMGLAVITAIGLLVASTWYFSNLKTVLDFGVRAGFGSLAKEYGMGDPLAIKVILEYWLLIINHCISSYYFFISAIIFLIVLIKSKLSIKVSPNSLFLLSWIIAPFLIFTLGTNKDMRYMVPIYPALTTFLSLGLLYLFKNNRFERYFLVLFFAFPVFQFLYMSFPLPWQNQIDAGKFTLISPNAAYAIRASSTDWPIRAIVEYVNADTGKYFPGTRPRVLVLAEYRYFNYNLFSYTATHYQYSFVYAMIAPKNEQEWLSMSEHFNGSQYVLVKTSGYDVAFNSIMYPRIYGLLKDRQLPFEEISRWNLPDGSEAVLYRHQP